MKILELAGYVSHCRRRFESGAMTGIIDEILLFYEYPVIVMSVLSSVLEPNSK
jgi:hypothetical protein